MPETASSARGAVVVGVDDSPGAARALDRALVEAEQRGRPLLVVHTWLPPVWLAAPPGLPYPDVVVREESHRWAERLVDRLVAAALDRRARAGRVTVRTRVEQGDPGRVLVEAGGGAAVLVVGGRGRGAIESAVLGSATRYVLHRAPCPVMVVPLHAEVSPPHSVVVGWDGSPASRAALRWGLAAARRAGCPLVALRAVGHDRHLVGAGGPVGHAGQELEDDQGVTVSTRTVAAPVAAALHAAAGPGDLLVVGDHDRPLLSGLLGSTADRCARRSPGAVVVVRDRPG